MKMRKFVYPIACVLAAMFVVVYILAIVFICN